MKKVIGKILAIISIVTIAISSLAVAAISNIPKFTETRLGMKLGTTQRISSITNIDPAEYYKLETSDSSVVSILDNGNLKALSTGLSKISYSYIDEKGETQNIYCYIEVSTNNSTYSEINGETASKIKVTLDLGGYTTVIESPSAAIFEFPDVKKEGYSLEGWYKDQNYTESVKKDERFNKDITLYAKWIVGEKAEPVVTPSTLYDDINGHWARYNIEAVTNRNLFKGVADRMFGPEKTMTRAMVITVFGRLDKVELTGRTTNFKDVVPGSYYEEYVAWGVENKIITGTSEETFSPNKEITREEMAVMMANYVKYKNYKYEVEEIDFTDEMSISSWAVESVKILNTLGIMKGNTDGSYNPKKVATRAEIATIFYNYLNYIMQ